jgi:hypothetical protein
MEVITNNFNNIPISQLYSKLSEKLAQLDKIDKTEAISNSLKKDYIEVSDVPKNYDEKDFERILNKFKKMDLEVRSHEQAHATIGATTTPISYNYQEGPDGKMYAVGGSVRLDTSMPSDPKAAQFKLDKIKDAVTSVDIPSSADIAISSQVNLNKLLLQIKGDQNANT